MTSVSPLAPLGLARSSPSCFTVPMRSPAALWPYLPPSALQALALCSVALLKAPLQQLFLSFGKCLRFLFFSCPGLRRTSPPSGSLSTAGNVLRTRPGHRPRRPVSRACCGRRARWKEGRPWGVRPEQARDPVSHVLVSPGWCEDVGVHRARLRWGSLQKPNANGCWPRCRVETELPGL